MGLLLVLSGSSVVVPPLPAGATLGSVATLAAGGSVPVHARASLAGVTTLAARSSGAVDLAAALRAAATLSAAGAPTGNTTGTFAGSRASLTLSFAAYATDEDVAVRAPGDYRVLCPAWQNLAGGQDGVFTADSQYVLRSASTDFLALGVTARSVCALTMPKSVYPGSGLLFAVDSVQSGALTLRSIGLPAGAGKPPGPAGGLTGVSFVLPTFTPQIEAACLEANHRFGIDPNVAIKAPSLVYDPDRELTQLVVLLVLERQFTTEIRSDRGEFVVKLKQVQVDLAACHARMAVKFGTLGEGEATKSPFSTMVRR